ncbi:MAG: hypothetical protein U1E12_18240 [Hydrogenophaga sp.]|uniref:hypothetical protein n=1 Tax=Hydrogenophaga sp. TaxID=1904254 RepID=UPI002ABC07F9|nr:hypothetical protein [Hydrogenophaga sp.]MDZ4103610.1 hypothetical protein [Hydrogenophaga sp.]MDZ4283105.1 hypothetical protein [Hydrogenophaga sp.]
MNKAARLPARAVQIAVAVSLLVLLAGACLVLRCWYPHAFWSASGVMGIAAYALGAHLGITALLYLPWRNRFKEPGSVESDVALLVFLMLGASLFSLSYLFAGRPVALVFAVDRVVLVRANEIRTTELSFAGVLSKGLRVSGPLQLIAARQSSDAERLDSIQLAMAGFDLHQRPRFWVDIDVQRDQLSHKSQSKNDLADSFARQMEGHNNNLTNWAIFLPLAGTHGNWALAIDKELKTFVPFKFD